MHLRDQVLNIVDELENPKTFEELEINAEEWDAELTDTVPAFIWLNAQALDIEYVYGSDGELLGSNIAVTLGGPNIWVDTRFNIVTGYWGGEELSFFYDDNLGLSDAIEDIRQ